MKTKIKKIILWFFALLLGTLLAAMLVTQSRFFKDWLRLEIQDIAAEKLAAEVRIGQIGGNLISDFQLKSLLIAQAADTVLYLPGLSFRIIPGRLLHNELQLKVLTVDSLLLFLRQKTDSSWNFQNLIKADSSVTSADEQEGWRCKINLQNIGFKAASINFLPLTKLRGLPDKILNCNLELDVLFENEAVEIELHKLYFSTSDPQLALERFSCKLRYVDSKISVEAIDLQTRDSEFSGSILYDMHPPGSIEFDLSAAKLTLHELNPFIEKQIIFGYPKIQLQGKLIGDSLGLNFFIHEKEQQIRISSSISDINNFENHESVVKLQNFEPGYWLNNDSLSLKLDGDLLFYGHGLVADSASFQVKTTLHKINFMGRIIDSLRADLSLESGNMNGAVEISGPMGDILLRGKCDDILRQQFFSLNLQAKNVDLNPLLSSDSLQSDLNFDVGVAGRNLNPDSLRCSFDFAMRQSSIFGVDIDTLFSWGSWSGDAGYVDSLHIESPLGRFFLSGDFALQSRNDIRFHGDLGNLQWVKTRLQADTLQAAGFFSGRIYGQAESLALTGKYQLDELSFNEFTTGNIIGDYSGLLVSGNFSAGGRVDLQKPAYANTAMDTASINWQFADSVFTVKFNFARQDSIDGHLELSYHIAEISSIQLAKFTVRIKNLYWEKSDEMTELRIGPDYYEIYGANFRSGVQNVRIAGFLRNREGNDLKIQIRRLEVGPIARFLQIDETLAGQISADILLTGNAQVPQFLGDVKVMNGRIMEFIFEKYTGKFSLVEKKLNWNFILKQDSLRGMQFDGFLPVNLAAKDDEAFIPENAPLRFHMINTKRGGLDLAFLQTFFPDMKNVEGRFLANVKVTNTWANPLPAGSVRIFDGKFDIPRYGVRYKNLQLAIMLDSTEVEVRQLELHGGKGLLSISGRLSFADGLQAGLQAADLNIAANEFQIAKNRDIFMVIDAKARLFGDISAPVFDGDIKLRRSTINLSALENSRYVEFEQMQPLLEQARLDTAAGKSANMPEVAHKKIATTDDVSHYYKNLKGELRIEIGRNTWLRSPALNVEVNGQLLQAKQGAEFEMPVGVVSVVRGSYDFLGKSFKIENGEFTFDGGDEINPLIKLEAVYSIRDADRNRIRIVVSGRVLDPKIKFYFNNEEIEESNAVSYIVFGRNLEQVSGGERRDLQSGQLLTQLAAAQLSKTLGKKLSLDVIEFQGKSEGDEASSITVGRYISDHIFISIQQLIGGENWETMAGLRATLELELRKNIFMQFTKGDEKSTGFDLIWKYQK